MKYLIKAVGLVLILSMFAACGTKWLQSPARDIYREAKSLLQSGKKVEAMVLATKAVITDPIQERPKELVYEEFDNTIKGAETFLQNSNGTDSAFIAEQRYATYKALVQIYENVSKMELPLKDKKGKWQWTTETVDYTAELETARIDAMRLLQEYTKKLLARHLTKEAWEQSQRIFTFYALETEKPAFNESLFVIFADHGKKFERSPDVNIAGNAYYSYIYALRYKDSEDIKQRAETTKLYVSELWYEAGKKLEAQNTLEKLQEADTYYQYALNWNAENQKAIEAKEEISLKIAEIFYQKGLAAEKDTQLKPDEVAAFYRQARQYVPDYKDAMNRMFTFSIMGELERVQNNINVSEREHDEFLKNTGYIKETVETSEKYMAKVSDVMHRIQSVDDKMHSTLKLLKTLKAIPMFSSVCLASSTAISTARTPVHNAALYLNKINKPIIDPSAAAVLKAKEAVFTVFDKIELSQKSLKYTKETFATAQSCLMKIKTEEEYKEYSVAVQLINETLEPMNKVLIEINNQFKTVNNAAIGVANLAGSAYDVSNALSTVEPIINTIGDAAKSVSKVLDEKYLGVSASDILNGVGQVTGIMLGWAEDLVKPYLKKIIPDIPTLPGIEEFQQKMEQMGQEYLSLQSSVDKLQAEIDKYTNYQNLIRSKVDGLKSACYGRSIYIQSAMEYGKSNKGFWDISGRNVSYEKGQSIKVWQLSDTDPDRKFVIEENKDGTKSITALHGLGRGYVDVSGNNTANGTDLQLWDKNTSSAQKFKIEHVSNGRYRIFTASGKIVCLSNNSTENGSNVHIWNNHNGATTEWVLIDTKTNKPVVEKSKTEENKGDKSKTE